VVLRRAAGRSYDELVRVGVRWVGRVRASEEGAVQGSEGRSEGERVGEGQGREEEKGECGESHGGGDGGVR
jgi:hypothetical protein